MKALVQSNLDYDFEAFNAAGQVAHKDTLIFEDYDTSRFLLYRIPGTKLGNANDASIEAWFTASAPAGTYRWVMRERGATLALSYVVWTENGPRQTRTTVTDTTSSLVEDVS